MPRQVLTPPPVDFANEVAAGVFAGQQPTDGYQVQIVGVERGKSESSVVYQVKSPPKDALVAQVLTQPFMLSSLSSAGWPHLPYRRLRCRVRPYTNCERSLCRIMAARDRASV